MRGISITRTATTTASDRTRAKPPPPVERSPLEPSTKAETLGQMILRSADRDGVALRYKVEENWREIAYRELVRIARDIGKGLIALGIKPGDTISILADTRPSGHSPTPARSARRPSSLRSIKLIRPRNASTCSATPRRGPSSARTRSSSPRSSKIRDACPALEHVIAFVGTAPARSPLQELIERGREIPEERVDESVAAVTPDDMASLVYTSGTTGPPKACILTHRNFTEAIHTLEEQLDLTRTDAPMEFFLFLPLAHVFARITQMFTLDLHGTLSYWQRDPTRLLNDIREARPTYLASVPRVWEKIFTAANAGSRMPKAQAHTLPLGAGRRVPEPRG